MSGDDYSLLAKRLDKQDEALHRIEIALVGDGPMGNPGLVRRINGLEKEGEKLHHKLIGAAVAAVGASHLKDMVISMFK